MTAAQYLVLAGLHAGILEQDASLSGSGFFTQQGEFLTPGKAAQYVRKALFPAGATMVSSFGHQHGGIQSYDSAQNSYTASGNRYTIQSDGSIVVSALNPLRNLFSSGAKLTYAQKLAYQQPWEQAYL